MLWPSALRAPSSRAFAACMSPRLARFSPGAALPLARTLATGSVGVPPLVLVMDLDETLLRPVVHGVHKKRTLTKVDVEVTIPLGNGVRCELAFRPGLEEFFSWIRKRRFAGVLEGPWLFAQGQPLYVDAILPTIDQKGDIFGDRVLDHRYCTVVDRTPGYNLKDLAKVPLEGGGDKHLSRMVLLENNAISCVLNPECALMVTDFEGDDDSDAELARVMKLLDDLIAEVQASPTRGAQGDYSGQLVDMTPGHGLFRERLAALHAKLEAGPKSLTPMKMKAHMTESWNLACEAKRELLGLKEGEH